MYILVGLIPLNFLWVQLQELGLPELVSELMYTTLIGFYFFLVFQNLQQLLCIPGKDLGSFNSFNFKLLAICACFYIFPDKETLNVKDLFSILLTFTYPIDILHFCLHSLIALTASCLVEHWDGDYKNASNCFDVLLFSSIYVNVE